MLRHFTIRAVPGFMRPANMCVEDLCWYMYLLNNIRHFCWKNVRLCVVYNIISLLSDNKYPILWGKSIYSYVFSRFSLSTWQGKHGRHTYLGNTESPCCPGSRTKSPRSHSGQLEKNIWSIQSSILKNIFLYKCCKSINNLGFFQLFLFCFVWSFGNPPI